MHFSFSQHLCQMCWHKMSDSNEQWEQWSLWNSFWLVLVYGETLHLHRILQADLNRFNCFFVELFSMTLYSLSCDDRKTSIVLYYAHHLSRCATNNTLYSSMFVIIWITLHSFTCTDAGGKSAWWQCKQTLQWVSTTQNGVMANRRNTLTSQDFTLSLCRKLELLLMKECGLATKSLKWTRTLY